MKYLPFIWANLRRKPLRMVFTLASVVFAFTLLGLVLGLRANLQQMAASARANRIYTMARFDGKLRLAQLDQISQMPDVAAVAALGGLQGYYRQPVAKVQILLVGSGMRRVFPEVLPAARDWQALRRVRNGVFVSRLFAARYGLQAGGTFPVISADTTKADGSDVWEFNVLGIVPDISLMPVGFAVGNYEYLDQARPQADQAEVLQFWVLARDAGHIDGVTYEIDRWFSSSAVPTRSVSEKVMLESAGGGNEAILALIGIAVAGLVMIMFLTSNALRHSIRERTTELAVLKTLGFSRVAVASLVLAEAALPCLAGCACGMAVAAGAAAVMPSILPAGVVMPIPRIDLEVVILGLGAALLIAALAAAMPVMRVTRLDVATALAKH